jgi:hypothetical protein
MFLAMFGAVSVMMAVSNSYVWRIQVSQLYYMVLAYIEVTRPTATANVPLPQANTKKEYQQYAHYAAFRLRGQKQ